MSIDNDPTVTRLPPTRCPACGRPLDAAGTTDGSAGTPGPGDLTACLRCGEPLRFTDTMDVRRLTELELAELPIADYRELLRVRNFARMMSARTN